MKQQEETKALERLLAEATAMSNLYADRAIRSKTPEQARKMQGRLTRYNALRTLIVDLMLG